MKCIAALARTLLRRGVTPPPAVVARLPVARVPPPSARPIRHFASRSAQVADGAAQSATTVGRKALGAGRRARSVAESNARLRLDGEVHTEAPPKVGPGSFWQKYRWQSTSDTGVKTSAARQVIGMTSLGVLAGLLVHANMTDWTGHRNSERVKRTVGSAASALCSHVSALGATDCCVPTATSTSS